MSEKQNPVESAVGLAILAAIAFGVWSIWFKPTPEERAAKQAQTEIAAAEREQKRIEHRTKGFHCLSGWDGSHREFVSLTKAQLRDPESFEHVETLVRRVIDGQHTITMQFRARNGFGGMNIEYASGLYDHETCAVTEHGIDG